ncbi:MAG: stage III sporulation protein AC/AD protein family [Ruminiclostridium sp.]|nr:stage III sporulation protein AC/AD protein family [Ruminiclostridium sp.]
MNIIAFVGAGIIGSVLSVVLRQYKPEFSIYITLITGMLMLGAAVTAVKPVIETVTGYLQIADPDTSYADVLVKSLAVCYITQMASDSCADAGEKSIAAKIELAGKFAIVLLALPVFDRLMEVIKQLLQ